MTSRQTLTLLAVSMAATLSACAPIVLAPAGAYKVGKGPAVTLDRPWNDISAIWVNRPAKMRLLSLDGPLLNRLYLSEGLVEGDHIVKPARRESTTPVYADAMSVTEQVEFVADSVTALEFERVTTERVRPVDVAGVRAVRFDILAKTKQGLDIKGVGQVLKAGGKLYVAIYLAPAEHYYAASLPSAERAMSTAVL